MNKNVLKYCKNYEEIINCEFLDEDEFSKRLISFYKKIIESTDESNDDFIKRLIQLDEALYNYIEDYTFSKKFRESIDVSSVLEDNFSYLNEFIEYLISFFKTYDKAKENVIVQTRWI
jgi:F0F1-type ATP synthase delta subunit